MQASYNNTGAATTGTTTFPEEFSQVQFCQWTLCAPMLTTALPTLRKMSFTQFLTQRRDTFLACLAPALAIFPNDDVACLVLIFTMLSAGEDYRDWLFDGFRCDCIRIFLHPQFLELASRVVMYHASTTITSVLRWTWTWPKLSYARVPYTRGRVPASLVRSSSSCFNRMY